MFVLFAFLLLSCAFLAQDIKAQSEGTLLIVPRVDVDPFHSLSDHSWSADLGLTSFYTYFDGNLGEHVSFSLANHWLAFSDFSFEDTRSLYSNTWRADSNNWVDWAYVTVNFGGFFASLGKDFIHFGTYEVDAYDHDSHWQLNSSLWNNYQVYQWGGRIGWTDEEETTKILFEVSSDQLMEKPFGSRSAEDYAYTLYGMHDFENVSFMASVSHCSIDWVGSLGLNVNFSDAFSAGLDGYIARSYKGAALKMTMAPTEKFDLFAKLGYESGNNELILSGNRLYTGAGAYWYPLHESRDLRIHAMAAYDSFEEALAFSLGLTYALNLQLF